MDEIAAAAGIGRKSLYRYFPSKPALVWGGFEVATAASQEILGRRHEPAPGDPLEVLRAAAEASVRALPDLAVTRGRLRLIAEHPELGAQSYAMLGGQRQAVVDFLVSSGLSGSEAYYVSAAYSAALFAGWLRWAQGEDKEPLPHLLEALRVLRIPGSVSPAAGPVFVEFDTLRPKRGAWSMAEEILWHNGNVLDSMWPLSPR